jgi:Family of unknown function (DUF6039)
MAGTLTAETETTAPAGTLHSANSGFIVHRTGQLAYDFVAEGGAFSADLVRYLNQAQGSVISTSLFTEMFGARHRLHWLVHMKSPHDYQRLLKMVDHDRSYQDISTRDRLPARGGGNWERMFVPGTFSERVLCPQHGFGSPPEGAVDYGTTFAAPARYQTTQPAEVQLNTATAGAVIVRTGQARYECREECRHFAVEWAEYVNNALPGSVTAFLFEEIFGRQDTLHLLIHLRSLDDYAQLRDLSARDSGYRALLERSWVPGTQGGGTWGDLYVPGSLHDTVLVPQTAQD